jgi:hypothetical protein
MLKSALISAAVILTSIPSAFAAAPGISLYSISTPYGTFGCIQRTKNKFYSMNATGMKVYPEAVWANLDDFKIGVWCRGQEAIITVAGNGDTSALRDEIKTAF